jgi:hypothetical protein
VNLSCIFFDQLTQSLLDDTLNIGGRIFRQHEVPGEVQTVDAGRPAGGRPHLGSAAAVPAPVGHLRRSSGAWERKVALRHLVALRFELPQDGSDEDREFLMSTSNLFETFLQQHRDEAMQLGLEQGRKGLRRGIRTVYESRFGPMPAALVAALDATDDLSRLEAWLPKAAIGSAEEIAAALAAGASGS